MTERKTNIHEAPFEQKASQRDRLPWHMLDLSGEHIGVRIEQLSAAATSSAHHFHLFEEEHVLVLDGTATLHLGDATVALCEGDHVWFPAGEATPHHIENTSAAPFKFLVFGERKQDDVVFYPQDGAVLVKSGQRIQHYTYGNNKS